MVYILWVYVYWFVYKTHFRHTVALAPENVAVRGLIIVLFSVVFHFKFTLFWFECMYFSFIYICSLIIVQIGNFF